MSVIRVFPTRTKMTPDDILVFAGDDKKNITADPPFPEFLPDIVDEVHVSVTFTWDLREGERLFRAWDILFPGRVKIGGPATGEKSGHFDPGMYLKHGITITSRGCPRKCQYCFVPKREGNIKTLPIGEGWIVQDDNLLAAPKEHVKAVFEMLRGQSKASDLRGIDVKLLRAWVIDELKDMRIKQIFIAYDSAGALGHIDKVVPRLLKFLNPDKIRCYVLVGFPGDTIEKAERRCNQAWERGTLPFAMLYRNEEGNVPTGWSEMVRNWSRPAITKAYAGSL